MADTATVGVEHTKSDFTLLDPVAALVSMLLFHLFGCQLKLTFACALVKP